MASANPEFNPFQTWSLCGLANISRVARLLLPATIGEVRERRGMVWDRRFPDPPSRRSLGFDKAGLAETPVNREESA